ncbi:MAG: 50S ribosomal protein L3 [Chlorobiota bacterium]|nr:50S ribosomal protein L3 [Chlorobiota bacterium]
MSVLLGRKLGMTQLYLPDGRAVACTVLEAGPCPVVQVRTLERDGYEAIQIGFEPIPERKVNKPLRGHFARAGVAPVRYLREFRVRAAEFSQGQVLTVELFAPGDRVKVSGVSKGRGFQGVVKRHGFAGVGMTTHGQSDRTRAPGSVGSSSFPSRSFKGLRMAGHMGNRRVTVRNLEVLKVLPEQNLLLVKGAVPGPVNGLVEIVKL